MDSDSKIVTSSKSRRLTRGLTRRSADFFWQVDSECVRGTGPGEHVLSRTFNRCNRTWQLRLESQGPNLPPQLSIELLAPLKWSLRAFVTCRLLHHYSAVGSLTKVFKLQKSCKRAKAFQRHVIGPVSKSFDSLECKIDVQYYTMIDKSDKNTSGLVNDEQTHSTTPSSDSNSEVKKGTHEEITVTGDPSAGQFCYSTAASSAGKDEAMKRNQFSKKVASSNSNADTLTGIFETYELQKLVTLPQQLDVHSDTVDLVASLKVLTDLLQRGSFSDVTLTTPSGQHFQAHKAILSVRSSKFYEMLKDHNAHQSEFQLHDVTDATFEKVLEFIYTGKVSNLDRNIVELYKASEAFNLQGLKNICLESFKEKLEIHNASDILILSDEAKLTDLKKHVIDFINQNIHEILKSDSFQKMTRSNPVLVVELYYSLAKSM